MHGHDHQWTEATLNAVATPVLVAEISHRVVLFANRAAVEVAGVDPVGLTIGHAFRLDADRRMSYADGRLITPDDNPVVKAARGEVVGPVEILWRDQEHVIPLVCYAERLPDGGEAGPCVLLSFFDTTDVRTLKERLARAEKVRDHFSQRAAHELRTPLTSLQLQVETIRRKCPDLTGIVAVGHAVARLTRRVEELLDAVDLHDCVAELHPTRVDLLDVVAEAARLVAPNAEWARCAVTVVPSPPIVGCWDQSRLTQVVASLLSNAVKFGPGKPIELRPRRHAGEASISVVDHGIGVAPKDRDRIFGGFERGAGAAPFRGLGLDLWVARELVNSMEGTITVDDTPGGGATFVVRLPWTTSEADPQDSA